jgi:molybdopterin converting factor small subunit
VRLRAPLRDRTGGTAEHDLPGATVGEVLRELQARHPPVTGWILDEQGRVRPHVLVFVNGVSTREDAALGPDDVLQVLPSISGGRT